MNSSAPAATASLVDGAFAFQRENGPVAGEYRVLFVMSQADSKHKGMSASIGSDGAPTAMDVDRLPDQEWAFDANVSDENSDFDFEVPG